MSEGALSDRWRDTAEDSPAAAAPSGLGQSWVTAASRGSQEPTSLAQRWYTGGNQTSMEMGWSTDFYDKMFSGDAQASDEGRLREWLESDDFTGVLTYDTETRKFGDVYEDGRYLGNIYERYDRDTANLLILDLTKTASEKARLFERGAEAVDAAVQAERERTEYRARAWVTQQEFEEAVQDRTELYQEGLADDALVFLGGGAGTAATGALIGGTIAGPVGAVVGGAAGFLFGGFASWLNRDELTREVAALNVKADMAREEFGDRAAASALLRGWGEVGQRFISPFGNVMHGVYDVVQGEAGDAESEWYAVDEVGRPKRLGVLTGLDVALGFADALQQWATPFGRGAYMATMGSTVLGKTALPLLTGGKAFNDRSGVYESFVYNDDGTLDVPSLLAGVGEIGIDVVQLSFGAALINKARTSVRDVRAMTGAQQQRSALFRLAERVTRPNSLGMKMSPGRKKSEIVDVRTASGFTYGFDSAGNAIGRRASIQILAPSEFTLALSTGARARRAAHMVQGGPAIDDYFRAANQLAIGERAYSMALINGFGEGQEEMLQAIFEPIMFDADIDPEQVFEAMMRGFAAGAGMSAGASIDATSMNEKQRAMAFTNITQISEPGLTAQEWNARWETMNEQEKREALNLPQAMLSLGKAAAGKLEAQLGEWAVSTVPEIRRLASALQQVQLGEHATQQARTGTMFTVTQNPDVESQPSHAVVLSLSTLQEVLASHILGLQIAATDIAEAADAISEDMRAEAAAVVAQGEALLQEISQRARRVRAALSGESPNRREALHHINKVNQLIADWWEYDDSAADAPARRLRARAVSVVMGRHPFISDGSFQVFMPQADFRLTEFGQDHFLMVGQAQTKPMNLDYDGDQFQALAHMVLGQESFDNLRTGAHYLIRSEGGHKVNIATTKVEKWEVDELARIVRDPDPDLREIGTKTIERIVEEIYAEYSPLPTQNDPNPRVIIERSELEGPLNKLSLMLSEGSVSARSEFLNTMMRDFSAQLARLARGRGSNEWIWLDQVVLANLQQMQRKAVAYRYARRGITRKDNVVGKKTGSIFAPTREQRMQAAATVGQTLGVMTEAATPFRKFQALHLDLIQISSEHGGPKGTEAALTELAGLYERNHNGTVRAVSEELEAPDEISARVIAQLRALANQYAQEVGHIGAEMVMAALGRTRSWDVDEHGRVYTGSVLQVLLRRTLMHDKLNKQDIATEALQNKWATYEALLSEANEAEAAIVLMSGIQAYDSVGPDAAALFPELTWGQIARRLRGMHEDERKVFKDTIQSYPEYIGVGRKSTKNPPYGLDELHRGEVTGFRAMVDALIEYTNRQVYNNGKGLAAGRRGDAVTKDDKGRVRKGRSRVQTETLLEAFTAARDLLHKQTQGKIDLSDGAAIRSVATKMPDFADALLRNIPAQSANALFKVDKNGQQHTNTWIYDLLALKPEEAVAKLWVYQLLTTFNAQGGRTIVEQEGEYAARAWDRLPRRMHRKLAELAAYEDGGIRMAKLMDRLITASSIDEIMQFINNELRGPRDALFIAWDDDVADWDLDLQGGGFKHVGDAAELRDAARSFRDVTKRLVKSVDETLQANGRDRHLMAQLADINNPNTTDLRKRTAKQLTEAIEFAQQTQTVAGPNQLLDMIAGGVFGIYSNAHVKADVPAPFATAGQVQVLGDAYGFATGLERHMTAMHTPSIDQVAANLQLTGRYPTRVMDNEGRLSTTPELSADLLVEKWMSDPGAQEILRAMVTPTVWESTKDGRLVQQSLVGKSLSELISRDPWEEMYDKGLASAALYLTSLNAIATSYGDPHAITKYIFEVAIARTSAEEQTLTLDEAGRRRVMQITAGAVVDVAKAIQVASELVAMNYTVNGLNNETVSLLEALRQQLTAKQREAHLAKLFGTEKDPALTTAEWVRTQFLGYARELVASTQDIEDVQEKAAALEAVKNEIKKGEQRVRLLMSSRPFDTAVRLFELPEARDEQRAQKKRVLMEAVRSRRNLVTRTPAKLELQTLIARMDDTAASKDEFGVVKIFMDDAENEKAWDTIGQILVVAYLQELTEVPGSSISLAPYEGQAKERYARAFDPTFSFLLDEVLDANSIVMQAGVTMHNKARRGAALNATSTMLETVLENGIVNNDKLGQHTGEIPRTVRELFGRLDAAAAGPGVQAAGLSNARQRVISRASEYNFKVPPEEFLTRDFEISYDELGYADAYTLHRRITRPDGTQSELLEMPLALLNGRFLNDARITYTDPATGLEATLVDLWNREGMLEVALPYVAIDTQRFPHTYRYTSTQRLRRVAERAVPEGTDMSTVKFSLDLLHPWSRPAGEEYSNSLFFEGVVMDVVANPTMSLPAARWANGGSQTAEAIQRTIDAQKEGLNAFPSPLPPRPTDSDGALTLEEDWRSNLAKVLSSKAMHSITHDTGLGRETPLLFNSTYRDELLRHYVRGFQMKDGTPVRDSDGRAIPEYWTAQQVINWQVANPGKPIPLFNAELFIPSDEILLTLLGEVGGQAALRPPTDVITYDLQKVPVWDETTEAWAKTLPTLFSFDNNSLTFEGFDFFESQAATIKARSKHVARPPVSDTEARKKLQELIAYDATRSEIYEARRQKYEAPDRAGLDMHTVGELLKAVRSAADTLSLADFGFHVPIRTEHDSGLTRKMLSELLSVTEIRPNQAVWIYNHGPQSVKNTLVTGVYSQASLDSDTKGYRAPDAHLSLAPDDFMFIPADTWEQVEEEANVLSAAKKTLSLLVEKRVKIALFDGKTGGQLRTDLIEHLKGLGYVAVNGSRHLFEPKSFGSTFQTARAYASSLTEIEVVHPDSHVLMLNVLNKPVADGAAVLVSSRPGRAVARVLNLLPVTTYGRFAPATSPQGVADTLNAVNGILREPQQQKHLFNLLKYDLSTPQGRQQSKKLITDLRRSVSAMEDGRVLPANGQMFTEGHIIPLLGTRGELLLYRHGHKPPDFQLDAMLSTPFEGDTRPGNVAVYLEEVNPDHKTNDGRILRMSVHPQYGLTVQLAVSLPELATKLLAIGAQLKLMPTTYSKTAYPLPDIELSEAQGLDFINSYYEILGKESVHGLIDNFREAYKTFHTDFRPELIEFFFQVTWDQLDETQQQVYITRLNELLRFFESDRALPKYDERVIAQRMRQGNLRAIFSQQLAAMNKAYNGEGGLQELSGVWERMFSSNLTPQAYIARGVMFYLMTRGAQANAVIGTNGITSLDDTRARTITTHRMPQILTDYLQDGDTSIRTYLIDKLNQELNWLNGSGWFFNNDFVLTAVDKNGDVLEGYLSSVRVEATGDSPVQDMQAERRQTRQKYSSHANAMGYMAFGAQAAYDRQLDKTRRFVTGEGVERFEKPGGVWRMLQESTPPPSYRHTPWRQRSLAEDFRLRMGRQAYIAATQPFDTSSWNEGTEESYNNWKQRVLSHLGLDASQGALVDGWTRQQLGRTIGEDGTEYMTGEDAVETVKDIYELVKDDYLPTHLGQIAQISYTSLVHLFKARHRSGWAPRMGPKGTKEGEVKANSWDEWVKIALGMADMQFQEYDPMFSLENDGFMHTFMDADSTLSELPVTREHFMAAHLMDPVTSQVVLTRDPHARAALRETPLIDLTASTYAELMAEQRRNGKFDEEKTSVSAMRRRHAARREWREKGGRPKMKRQTGRSFYKKGAEFVDESSTNNAFLRIAFNLRLMSALFNPLLVVSAIPEMLLKGAIDDTANFISGHSTTRAGQLAASAAEKVGIEMPYTSEQVTRLQQLYSVLAQRKDFLSMLYQSYLYQQPRLSGVSWLERQTARGARFAAQLQDPTWGQRADLLAQRYVQSALQYVLSLPTDSQNRFSVDYFIDSLFTDPLFLQKYNLPAHRAGVATVANIRNLKPTVASLALRGVSEPLSQNPKFLVSAPSTLFLKIPLAFATYSSNVFTSMLGLQHIDAMIATWLDGRNKKILGRVQAKMRGEKFDPDADNTFDMSTVLEGVDLTKAFIQSGVTHTALFAFGLMAGGLGLSGEDDEDRRRRRAAAYQGVGHILDPREVENDFRNADAVFFDSLPGWLSWLPTLFRTGDDEESASMGHMHWILRQFLSPVLGMARFFDTGDSRQIVWGFQDALGAFPLVNANTWNDAVTTFATLDAASRTALNSDDEQAAADAFGFALSGMMIMERMLLENSFVNMLYVGKDQYDRDPWVMALTDENGNIRRNLLGEPEPTDALETFFHPETGEIRQGYVGPDDMTAAARSYAENRLTWALMSSLFTGQAPWNSSFMRGNMVPKIRSLSRNELTGDGAEELVMSVWDEEVGIERLNDEGARAVFQGIYKKSVDYDSPALEGVYVSYETRQNIQREWMAEMIQEGIDLGLTQSEAVARTKDIWYGPDTDPTIEGLGEILFSDRIPYQPDLRYYQLNTTYVIGPDGRPWATGVQRDSWLNAFGLLPLGYTRYYSGGDLDKAMPIDERLNSVDIAANLNTGLRALQKVDPSWEIPSVQEALDRGFDELSRQTFFPSYSSGGGRGGGGSYTRLYAPVRGAVPYMNAIPFINISNPIVRRASVRRERTTSQRGRLKQWQ